MSLRSQSQAVLNITSYSFFLIVVHITVKNKDKAASTKSLPDEHHVFLSCWMGTTLHHHACHVYAK